MKKKLLLLSLVSITISANASLRQHSNHNLSQEKERFDIAQKAPKYAAATEKWLPGTIQYFHWYSSDDTNYDWNLLSTEKISYNTHGWKTKEVDVDSDQITEYTYNDKGQITTLIFSDQSGTYRKTEYAYDDITGLQISEKNFSFIDEKWQLTNTYERRITRDSKGNIIKVEEYDTDSDSGSDKLILCSYSEIKYGADGKANEIINYDIYEGKTEIEFHLGDIVWQNTDGQIIIDDTNDMDFDDYFMGNNRIKSAKILSEDNPEHYIDVTAQYPDSLGSVTVTFYYDYTKTTETIELTILDQYGSFRQYEVDVDGYTYLTEEKYDAYGLFIEYFSEEKKDGNTFSSKLVSDVKYDEAHGYPLEISYKSSFNGKEFTNTSKRVFSDYAQYDAAVENIETDSDAPVEYFNLQGLRVENPENGLYIRRQGSKTTKILVK